MLRLGIPTTTDIAFGIIMIFLILEASRRSTGWVLVIIAGVLLLYTFIGPWIPGILGHKGYSLSRVVSQMYLTTEGIFGTPLGVSASYIFLFVFLTSMLEKIGMGDFLWSLPWPLWAVMPEGRLRRLLLPAALWALSPAVPWPT